MFWSKLPVEISTDKGFGRIYKYDQWDWPYTYPNNTFLITTHFDNYVQTQHNSASEISTGTNDVSSAGLYQINNHHGNTDVKDNYDSQSYDTPYK